MGHKGHLNSREMVLQGKDRCWFNHYPPGRRSMYLVLYSIEKIDLFKHQEKQKPLKFLEGCMTTG